MTAPLKLALVGLGTVGQGVVELIQRNGEVIAARLGRSVRITGIAVRDLTRARDVNVADIPVTDDAMALARDGDYDVLVELIGGETTARAVTEIAFSRGKSVVNANKALIARHGNELLAQAESAGVGIGFEAAVAGGIPVLKALREGLVGNQVSALAGIINGTSNYILTQMGSKGQAFADALADAQRLGYAEADPTFDIEGIDAAHKLTILASLAFGIPLDFDALSIEGISAITPQDIRIARELGYAIKHLGIAKREADGGVSLRVHPTLVPTEHLLAKVDGVLNAVLMRGDGAGPVCMTGAGAGRLATASAVLADIIDLGRSGAGIAPPLGQPVVGLKAVTIHPAQDAASAFYLRLRVADAPGVLKGITSVFAELDISIEAIQQREPREGDDATVALITSETTGQRIADAVARIEVLPFVREQLARIRVEHFEA
ncbi:homoserine dehydrogenase [Polycyclovorans algicola]|uniref:homoserine dehydrogenase n=1 Tax=Polycyclovorans algicola TaxID=616992 RepID=UPI0004A72BE8|nr:homoserine dehydrogenase [Polycyclovorans algicola]